MQQHGLLRSAAGRGAIRTVLLRYLLLGRRPAHDQASPPCSVLERAQEPACFRICCRRLRRGDVQGRLSVLRLIVVAARGC